MMMQAGGSQLGARNMGGLLNPASGYQYPLTTGLLGAVGNATNTQTGQPQPQVGQMPAGVPNYSQIAYESAGSPHYGPYAQVAPPSGIGVPGTGAPSSGSKVGAAASGLLSALVQNPTMAKNLIGDVKGLLGSPTATGNPTPPDPQMTQMPFDVAAATPPAVLAGAAPIASQPPPGQVTPGQPVTTGFGSAAAPAAAVGGAGLAAGLLGGGAPAGTVTLGALGPTTFGAAGGAGAAAGLGAADALAPIVPAGSLMAVPGAAGAAAAGGAGAAGSAAALSPLAGGLAAGAIALAPVLAGLMTPAVQNGAKYWSGLADTLNANAPPGNVNFSQPNWWLANPAVKAWWNDPQKSSAFFTAQNELAMNGAGNPYTQAQLNAWGIPAIQQQFASTGANPVGGAAGLSPVARMKPF